MSYRTNLVSLKQEVLDRLHELITPDATHILTVEKANPFEDFTGIPLIKNYYNDTVYGEHPIVRVWKEYDSEVEDGYLMAETYDADGDELNTSKLEDLADLDELIALEEYLEELNKQ